AYNQLYSPFTPYMSIIDLIFNYGKRSLSILTGKIEREYISYRRTS
ncbi:MAG: WbqC family protein, partial [Candidatus Omnitrophota bacterium]|nr:WbqC family protein [Candidatus Omnitrophota bacterium]